MRSASTIGVSPTLKLLSNKLRTDTEINRPLELLRCRPCLVNIISQIFDNKYILSMISLSMDNLKKVILSMISQWNWPVLNIDYSFDDALFLQTLGMNLNGRLIFGLASCLRLCDFVAFVFS